MKHEWEIVYVDNNSTDNSVQVVKSLNFKDNRVKLFHCQKPGPSPARNVAIRASSGDVWVFLDVDDTLSGDVVNKQISLSRNGTPSQCQALFSETRSISPVWQKNSDFNFFLNFGNQSPFSTFVCPRSSLVFNEDFETSEDWIFILQNRKLFNRVTLITEVGRNYRQNSGFSHTIPDVKLLKKHEQAFALYYRISIHLASEILNRFYSGRKQHQISRKPLLIWLRELHGLYSLKSLIRLARLFYV